MTKVSDQKVTVPHSSSSDAFKCLGNFAQLLLVNALFRLDHKGGMLQSHRALKTANKHRQYVRFVMIIYTSQKTHK